MNNSLTEKQIITLWFVQLRWGAVGVMFLVIFLLKFLGKAPFPLLPPLFLVFLVTLYNFAYPFFIRRYPIFSEKAIYTYLRATTDIIVVSFLVHFTGGITSPFVFLYILEQVVVSIVGFERIGLTIGIQSTLLYLTICLAEAYFLLPHYQISPLSESLFLNIPYVMAKTSALLLTSLLAVYVSSFLAKQLCEKQKQVQKLSTAKIDFMNSVVHEIKSPLTSILGYIDMLLSQNFGEINKDQVNFLSIIKKQAHRILKMAEDLLSLSRLEAQQKLDRKPINLSEIADRAIEELKPEIDSHKLTLIREFDPETPQVSADEEKILEVFLNLISNAIKFSNENGKIFVTISSTKEEVVVSVQDEGLGISPIDLPHIFERFYRSSKESMERRGTGLGLALSRSIIEAHGGRIWAVSAGPGQGSVFYFTLPLKS